MPIVSKRFKVIYIALIIRLLIEFLGLKIKS